VDRRVESEGSAGAVAGGGDEVWMRKSAMAGLRSALK